MNSNLSPKQKQLGELFLNSLVVLIASIAILSMLGAFVFMFFTGTIKGLLVLGASILIAFGCRRVVWGISSVKRKHGML